MTKVIVTGSSGFLGSELVRRLLEDGYDVYGIDKIAPDEECKWKYKWILADIASYSDEDRIYSFCKKADLIIHCAASVPITRVGVMGHYRNNVEGTKVMLDADYRKFIYISSSAIYGSPNGVLTENSAVAPIEPYGESKYLAELVCQTVAHHGANVNIIRPRTIIGKTRMGILDILYERISNDKSIPLIGDGSNLFQLVHIDDLIDAIYKVAFNDKIVSKDYNIGAGRFNTLKSDLNIFAHRVGSKSVVKCYPLWTRYLLRILDKLNVSPMTAWHYDTIFNNFVFDISKARTELGWVPKYSNDEMLVEAYNWYKDNVSCLGKSSIHKSKLNKRILKILDVM